MRRLVVIGVILLVLSVTILPRMNYADVKAASDPGFVYLSSEACGVSGFGKNTVQLSQEQYQKLQHYLIEFQARLDATTTRAEALLLFKDAVVELNQYGLLPKGMTVHEAQRLVIRNSLPAVGPKTYAKASGHANYGCLLLGVDNESIAARFGVMSFYQFLEALHVLSIDVGRQDPLITKLAQKIWVLNDKRNDFPLYVGTEIYLKPCQGHLLSFGLLGLKTWRGFIDGGYQKVCFPDIPDYHLGVIGFTGIHFVELYIQYHHNHCYYLGSALAVNII